MGARKSRDALEEDLTTLHANLPAMIREYEPARLAHELESESELILFHASGEDRTYVLSRLRQILAEVGLGSSVLARAFGEHR